MTARYCRLVASILPLVIAIDPLSAQVPSRLEAGAGAGGSVFGWQPRVGVAAAQPFSLGPVVATWHGSFNRLGAPSTSLSELTAGARVSGGTATTSTWLGFEAIRRSGFKDVVEQPRVETGGWRRFGNLVLTISAARRNAHWASMSRFSRTITGKIAVFDTVRGTWDSIPQTRTFDDSARIDAQHRWAETEAGLAWEGRKIAVALAMGGRLASHGVPAGTWGSANLAVRLASPVSLVVGAGTASSARFALDGEHRYVTLGLRLRPTSSSVPTADHAPPRMATVSAFVVDSLGAGRYRLTIDAPRARRVELTGDFTNWKPVQLSREVDGRWALTLALSAGTHRLNARVDGGRWIVPPGLTTMSDDFAGEVGLLVIDGQRGDTP